MGWLACLVLLLVTACAPAAQAQTRLIVRDSLGLPGINLTCLLMGCKVVGGLGDPNDQLFLVTLPAILNPVTAILKLNLDLGILSVELDQTVNPPQPNSTGTPSYLTDSAPVSYYGATVWHGYLVQPGNQLIRTAQAQSAFNTTGSGVVVAVIDTGVDVNHPVLKAVLYKGYDFTRNTAGGNEDVDVSGNSSSNSNSASPATLDQRTVAVLDQRSVAVLDGGGNNYSDFGHGTMTAGLVHLVAPQAKIMPLKVFTASGSAYESDILRAIYYAVGNGAQVMSMSWNLSSYSTELAKAIQYSNSKGVVSVASAGNDGQRTAVYPGALPGVIDVASTSLNDTQSSLHQLRCAAGVDGRSWRRHRHHLSMGHLRRGLGHFVQHASRRGHCGPDDGHQQQLLKLDRSVGLGSCRLYRRSRHGLRPPRYLSGDAGLQPSSLEITAQTTRCRLSTIRCWKVRPCCYGLRNWKSSISLSATRWFARLTNSSI